jgi:DNA-binding IclR family transcriptional regulator
MKAEQPAYWAEHGNKIRLSASEYVRLGFTWSAGDARPELHACAVPLRTRLDGEIVVLNCSVRARDLKVRQLEQEIGPQIVAAARRIDSGMGVAWNAN